MIFTKEIIFAKKNIYVSRAISKLEEKTSDFERTARDCARKYTEHDVRQGIKALYYTKGEIKDINQRLVSETIKSYRTRLRNM